MIYFISCESRVGNFCSVQAGIVHLEGRCLGFAGHGLQEIPSLFYSWLMCIK